MDDDNEGKVTSIYLSKKDRAFIKHFSTLTNQSMKSFLHEIVVYYIQCNQEKVEEKLGGMKISMEKPKTKSKLFEYVEADPIVADAVKEHYALWCSNVQFKKETLFFEKCIAAITKKAESLGMVVKSKKTLKSAILYEAKRLDDEGG